MVTKATSTMSFPSKAWHLVATSLAPPWVRWWKRTSCLTHPAQLRNWTGEFPGHVENTWGPPSRACGLPPGGWRYGSVKKKRYFRWSKPRFKFRLGRLGWEASPKKWPRDVKKKNHTNQVDEEMILPKDPFLSEYGRNCQGFPSVHFGCCCKLV